MIKWEYALIESYLDSDDFRKLGREGWELIAIRERGDLGIIYYFKRQIMNEKSTNERLAFKRLLDRFGSEQGIKDAIEDLDKAIKRLEESAGQ